MIIKDVVSGVDAHKRIYSGLQKLAKTVGSTFGPNGHSVSLQKDDGNLHCTKDGVTVARELTFADQIEFCGSTYIKDIANNTVSRISMFWKSKLFDLLKVWYTRCVNSLFTFPKLIFWKYVS